MSPRTSRNLANRIAGHLRVAALLALLLTQIPPALATDQGHARAMSARPALAAVGVTATQSDLLLVDLNGNRRVDPGDTLRYTVAIHNGSGADLSGLTFEEMLDANTTLVAGSLQISPLAFPDNYAASRGTALAIAAPAGLLKNDTGTPAPTVTARSLTTAAGGTASISADGSFSYTPPPGYTGIDSFSYSVENSAGSDTGTVTLTVSAVPVAVDDSYPIVQNSVRSFPAPGVLANDTGFPPPSVTPFSGTTTAGGSVTIASNGGFSYSPPTDFTGVDTFVYTATNSAGSDTATVTLTVGIAPLAQDDASYISLFNAPLSVPAGTGVLQNDTLGTPAATVLSFGGGALPGTVTSNAAGTTAGFGTGGTLKLNADGSFDFTPSAGFTGMFSFGYRISNPFGISDAIATITVQQLPAITSAAAITFTVGITGSFSVTTIGFPTPAITQTGALPNGVTFVDNGDGTGTLSGAPALGSGGSYPLSFSAGNQAGMSPIQSFTLTVQQGPAITSASTASFTVGASGIFTVTTTGYPTPTIGLDDALPYGLTFVDNGDGTGTLSGTPSGPGGSYPLTFRAANSAGVSLPQDFTLVIGEKPVITSADAITFTVGVAGSFTIAASGYPTPTITRAGALLPLGLTFTNHGDGTATLSGTPGSGSGGVKYLTFTASNSAGSSSPQLFRLTIREAPAITSVPSAAFEIGASEIFTVTASGYPTPTLAKLGTLPPGIIFVDHGDGTATLSGTPSGPGGSYPLSLSAVNAAGTSASQSFTLIVGSAPAIGSADAVTLTVGVFATFAITTTGFPGAAITLTGALPNGVTFANNGDGSATLIGQPAAGSAGSYPLTLNASNMFGSSAPQSFTLKVQASAPLAHGVQPAAAPLSVSIGTLPAGKQVTIIFDTLIVDPLPVGVSQVVNQGTVSASGFTSVLTDDPDRPGAADPTITSLGSPGFLGSRTVYMPLAMYNSGPPLADLVVSEITTSGTSLQVTIKNIGQLAVQDSFWVDAYINPTSAPVRVNQQWSALGSRGATWIVLGSALPFEPGETLTLTLGDSYYRPRSSNPGGVIAAGAQLYAQVDSFSATSSNGAVEETHERNGEVYNNILGPVVVP